MTVTVLPTPILNAIYTARVHVTDHAAESKTKITRLANAGAAGNLVASLNALEGLMHASLDRLGVTQQMETTVTAGAASTSGLYTLANLRLVLGFEREHPLNPSKIITAGYAIPSPVNAIVSTANPKRPVMVRGIAFSATSGPTEDLGALVDWLEDALTYEDVTGEIHAGGWTYVESRSGLASVSGVIDGDIKT
jgi:hypothetical protein